jgi:Flp pilus assembly protein TadB
MSTLVGCAVALTVALLLRPWRRSVRSDGAPARRGRTHPELDAVDVLDRLARDLRSGIGVTVAVSDALASAPSLLPDVATALARQVPLDVALAQHRPSGDEAALVLHALRLGAAHPPAMPQVLARTGDAIRERRAWRSERRVQAAQARASARVLTALPLVFAGWGIATSPQVRHTLATSPVTLIVVAIGLGLNVGGWIWMRAVVAVR